MTAGELPPTTVEALARTIHEDYRRRRDGERGGARGRGDCDDAALVPWDELPEVLRASNRAQARDIGQKMASIGYDVVAGRAGDSPPFVLGKAEVEVLARAEHTRFVEERIAAGWRYGSQRDVAARTSPTLVGWQELSEEERDLDRDAVRLIPALLASAGLGLVPRRT